MLSEAPVQREHFVDVGRYKVYEDDADTGARVRPPDRLTEVVDSQFAEGDRVAYLAYEAMVDNDNGMVYLLSTQQLLQLLPDAAAENVDNETVASATAGDGDGAASADGEVESAADGEVESAADGGLRLRDAILRMPGLLPPL